MIPMLRSIPDLLGLAELDMKVVTGITIVQVLFASGVGVLAHRKVRKVSRNLVLFMGSASFIGSLAGAVSSKYLNADVLTIIFVGLAALAAGLVFIPKKRVGRGYPSRAGAFQSASRLWYRSVHWYPGWHSRHTRRFHSHSLTTLCSQDSHPYCRGEHLGHCSNECQRWPAGQTSH